VPPEAKKVDIAGKWDITSPVLRITSTHFWPRFKETASDLLLLRRLVPSLSCLFTPPDSSSVHHTPQHSNSWPQRHHSEREKRRRGKKEKEKSTVFNTLKFLYYNGPIVLYLLLSLCPIVFRRQYLIRGRVL
jgi:hypothetical protein